jgi:hypothetical protein
MRKLRWLEQSVQKITLAEGTVCQRLVRDFVLGVYLAGTTILSGVARALRADRPGFEAVLERLSRGLGRQGQGIAGVCARYRRWVTQAARRGGFDVVAIDLSEVVKPYGRKMPFLCKVRDASKSDRHKTVIEQGWWTVEIAATSAKHQVLPLLRHAYSTVHPTFKSVQKELRRCLTALKPLLWPGVRAVLDRGFDGNTEFKVLDDTFAQWAVRQRGDRQVYLPGHDETIRMVTLAKAVAQDFVARPWVVHRDKLVRVDVRFGYVTVEVPQQACRRERKKPPCRRTTLIVVNRQPQDPTDGPMMLLCSRPVRNAAQARLWVESYFRRWGVEDETRGAKQLSGLEHLRVLNWDSVCNIVALSAVITGLLALLQVDAPRRAARLARAAPIDGAVPAYALYRIWLSVALLLRGHAITG